MPRSPRLSPFPYTTLFRSAPASSSGILARAGFAPGILAIPEAQAAGGRPDAEARAPPVAGRPNETACPRSEEHTSELQSLRHLVCRLLLEKKNPDQTSARH